VVFGVINLVDALTPEVDVDHLRAQDVAAVLGLGSLALGLHGFGEAFYEGVTATTARRWRAGDPSPRPLALVRAIPYLALIGVNLVIAATTTVGLFALVVPGLLAGTYLALAPALVEVERLGVRDALRRSIRLIRGSFWPVFAVVWVAYLGTLVASEAIEEALHHVVVEFVATTMVEAALAPFYGLAIVLVTFALIDRERATLEARSRYTSPTRSATDSTMREGR
jgi:hypothetical protein